jgi:hypothetical protein
LSSILRALELVGVEDRPPDPLDQLAGEVVGLQVAEVDPLAIDNGVVVAVGPSVGLYEYLRHGFSFHSFVLGNSVATALEAAVNVS